MAARNVYTSSKTLIDEAIADIVSALIKRNAVSHAVFRKADDTGEQVCLSADTEALKRLHVFPQHFKENIARILMELAWGAGPEKIAVVLLPCELRAAVELMKLNRLRRDNFIFVSPDCCGVANGGNQLRRSCSICANPGTPETADIIVSELGSGDRIFLFGKAESSVSDCLDGMAEKQNAGEVSTMRDKELEALCAKRSQQLTDALAFFEERFSGTEGFRKALEPCIGCHACMRVCPVCYCDECFFESPDCRRDSGFFFEEARLRGAIKIPHDVLYFHLGRMNHIAASCVGCGVCSEVCPMQIPLDVIYHRSAAASQALFDYLPGRDLKEPLPITTYRETELEEMR